MSKYMLIDSAHLDETRVAVVDEHNKLEKFDFETQSKAQIKGNVYLGKVVRVEPSLQAAFVDCGNGRHGFLSFSEIHHDYFQIPVDDRQELEEKLHQAILAKTQDNESGDDEVDAREIARLRYQFYRRYKIQEVIKKRQIMLVQVTKEERGNKGAALTTYISLAGRYCVLMPNMAKNNGISRKITNPKDREKLKKIVTDLEVENGSTVIRTAGVGHSKTEIKKDFSYLKKIWDEIRETTLKSNAPSLIYEEANIIKRAIRDLYSRDIDEIYVEGDAGYKIAKNFMKKLIPTHAKKVQLYKDPKLPLFSKFKVNEQVNQIYSTRVDLPSGGYLVINVTEALIAIDVNSGKATRERDLGVTALKTNLEAAIEIARQCRLRDLAGIVVVDFIDMEDKRSNDQVERCMREALRDDKARIQVGQIGNFGLLEFSRQRLRSSIADANMIPCPHCSGIGLIWSDEAIALQVLRKIEETCSALELREVNVTLASDVAVYILNNKRDFISTIEARGIKIIFKVDPTINSSSDFEITPVSKDLEEDSEEHQEQISAAHIQKSKKTKKFPFNKVKRDNKQSTEVQQKHMESSEDQNTNEEKVYDTGESYTWKRNNWRRNKLRKYKKEIPIESVETETIENSAASNESNIIDYPIEKDDSEKSKKEILSQQNTDSEQFPQRRRIRKHRSENQKITSENEDQDQTEPVKIQEKGQEKHGETDVKQMTYSNGLVPGHEIDFSNAQVRLAKLAKTYRAIEKDLGNITVGDTSAVQKDTKIIRPKKTGWWQKLIKKPDEE